MALVDLTHPFSQNMPVYPSDPVPVFKQTSTIEKEGYIDFTVTTGMHIGTHVDAPLHFIKDGKFIADFPVEKFYGQGVLIDARGQKSIDVDLLGQKAIKKDSIVLVLTGFSQKFGQKDYYEAYPAATEAFAKKIIALGVKILGLDTSSPDHPPFPIHKLLLAQEVLLLENLTNLESLVGLENFEIMAFPPKLQTDGSPIRVVAKI